MGLHRPNFGGRMKAWFALGLGSILCLALSLPAQAHKTMVTREVQLLPATYLIGGLGGTFLANDDAGTYFGHSMGQYFRPGSSLGWGFSLGQLGLELGWD